MSYQLKSIKMEQPSVNGNGLLDQLQTMVRKECTREIDQACAELAISADPYNWSVNDVHKWLRWMQNQIPELATLSLEHIQMNGMTLCAMPQSEFQLLFPVQVVEKLFAKLELWRMAVNFIRPDILIDSLFSEESQNCVASNAYNQCYSSPQYSSPYTPSNVAVGAYQSSPNYTSNGVHYTAPSTMYQTSDYGSEAFTSDDEMSDDGSSYSRANYSRASSSSSNNSAGYSPMYSHLATTTTVMTQSYYGMPQNYYGQNSQNVQLQQQSFSRPSSVSPSPMHSPAASASSVCSYSPVDHFNTSNYGSLHQMPQSYPTTTSTHITGNMCTSNTVSSTPVRASPVKTVSSTPSSTSSHIHLWQFLKELLASPSQFGASIRWIDRSKGVFKIEDSVRVAKLWGARKNRPAMNYDKLSRSIRQYYKKGIMKKTERSQRLVYQFCPSYAA